MIDFSHLRKLHVQEAAEAEYVFEHPITGDLIASIWFRPMTDDNAAFMNERVRIAVERAEQATKETKAERRARVLSSEQVKEDRDQDLVLLARTCAKRWGHAPLDVKGKAAEFSEDNCLAFLRSLPSYMADPCRNFCSNVYNFIERPALTEADGDKLGNS